MLNNFNLIKSCFDSDDDDSEKFEIKNKKKRKISYNPKANLQKRRQKRKPNFDNGYSSEGTIKNTKNKIIFDKKLSIDYSKFELE